MQSVLITHIRGKHSPCHCQKIRSEAQRRQKAAGAGDICGGGTDKTVDGFLLAGVVFSPVFWYSKSKEKGGSGHGHVFEQRRAACRQILTSVRCFFHALCGGGGKAKFLLFLMTDILRLPGNGCIIPAPWSVIRLWWCMVC